jgi:cell division protein FtsQ
MIEKSDVFVSIDGVLKAVVKQKTPVARVLDRSGSFTLIMRVVMPLSSNFTARVPLSGKIDRKIAKNMPSCV